MDVSKSQSHNHQIIIHICNYRGALIFWWPGFIISSSILIHNFSCQNLFLVLILWPNTNDKCFVLVSCPERWSAKTVFIIQLFTPLSTTFVHGWDRFFTIDIIILFFYIDAFKIIYSNFECMCISICQYDKRKLYIYALIRINQEKLKQRWLR